MAYLKSYNTKSGITGTYWKITDIVVSKIKKCTDITVSLYINEETRNNNCSPILKKYFTVKNTDIDFSKDIFEECYVAIKTSKENMLDFNGFFTDAVKI